LLPFCAVFVTGWLRLAQRGAAARMALWTLVLTWAFATFGSFWISANKCESWRNTAILQERNDDLNGAVESLHRALQLNPADADSHLVLAGVYTQQTNLAAAMPEYVRAVQLNPNQVRALDALAALLAEGQAEAVVQAIRIATHACDVTAYRHPVSLGALANACAKAGKWDEARSAAQIACELARQEGDSPSLRQNQALLESLPTKRLPPAN
jgi:Tfp pilus assembly protein PilF